MKIGIRKPSLSKSLKARTTGKVKRSIKESTIPGYGRKGTGLLRDSKRSLYNRGYSRSTKSLF